MTLAESSSTTHSPDNLIAGGSEVVTQNVTIASGANLVRGEVVGRVAASGKIIACDPDVADGSETPIGIQVHSVDASAADAAGQIYTGGSFFADELTWHANFSAEEKLAAFDRSNINLV